MRAFLAERDRVNPVHKFFLLWVLGIDLPGAITNKPTDGEALPPVPHNDDQGEQDTQGDVRHKNVLRFSLAGVQIKFSAINEARGGLTIPAKGVGGSWIVKLPAREFAGVLENEFSMMTLVPLIRPP